MVQMIRKDRGSDRVRGWAIAVLTKAGIDGRSHPSVRQQAQALLDAVRSGASYTADPAGIEFVSSTEGTLCLAPDKCIRGGDCDDLTVALCSAMSSIGLQVCIFLQHFQPGQQDHVLAGVQDEIGNWLYADPSLANTPVGERTPGVTREERIDPLDAHSPTGIAEASPEIITFGRAPSGVFQHNGDWLFHDGNQYLIHREGQWQAHGLTTLGPRGVAMVPVGAGAVGDTVTWILVGTNAIPGVGPAVVTQAKAAVAKAELQDAVSGLKNRLVDLRASLANLATAQAATGNPATEAGSGGETGPSSFIRNPNGSIVWTAGVASYMQWLLSWGDSIASVGDQALSGQRRVGIVDTVTDFLIEALPTDVVNYGLDAATGLIQAIKPDGTPLGTVDKNGNRQGAGVGLQGVGVGVLPIVLIFAGVVIIVIGIIAVVNAICDAQTAETNQKATILIAEAVKNQTLDPDKAQALLNGIQQIKKTDGDAAAEKQKNDPFAKVTQTAAGILNTALIVGGVLGALWVGKVVYDGVRDDRGLKKLDWSLRR